MSRIAIETLERQVHAAYHSDPFHAFRKNVESVQPEEWDIRPVNWSTEVRHGNLPVADLFCVYAGAIEMNLSEESSDGSG